MSVGKKILLTILGIMVVLVVAIMGLTAKLYFDVKETAEKTYESAERTEQSEPIRSEEAKVEEQDAFTVLLMGIDTGDDGRTDQGRSDTMILATVSPKKEQTTLISLERDTYTEIIGHGTTEKLNSAYAYGGSGMAMDTVESLLDVPVDHYVTLNMAGLKELVDAVGGIQVSNDHQFTYSGSTFDIGLIQLDGANALKYARMRYDDPEGNYGRQERQRKVIMGIIRKAMSLSGATQYTSVLDSIAGNMKTDLTFDELRTLAVNYRGCFNKVIGEQLKGEGFMQDNISYQRVSDSEIARIQTLANEQLGLTQ